MKLDLTLNTIDSIIKPFNFYGILAFHVEDGEVLKYSWFKHVHESYHNFKNDNDYGTEKW